MNDLLKISIIERLRYTVGRMKSRDGYQFRNESGTMRNGLVDQNTFIGWVVQYENGELSRSEIQSVLKYANQLAVMVENEK